MVVIFQLDFKVLGGIWDISRDVFGLGDRF